MVLPRLVQRYSMASTFLALTLLLAAGVVREPAVPLWVMETGARVLLGAWLFCFGASVGSFLNVVVYRLPRGMSLAHPGSHCPSCGHAIRGRDNIPVLSWLLLGGKCRDCHAPISARYYYVELVVALVFLLVAIFEAFLPRDLAVAEWPLSRPQLRPQEVLPFWCAYATHVILLTTLIGAALIDFDGFRVPRRLFLPGLAVGLALPIVWPNIRRLPAADLDASAWQVGLLDGAAGLAAGGLLGGIAGFCWWLCARRTWPRFAPVLLFAAVGAVLGWQRTTAVVFLTTLAFFVTMLAQRSTRTDFVVPLAAVAGVFVAPLLVESAPVASLRLEQIASQQPVKWLALSVFGVTLLSLGSARFAAPQYLSSLPAAAAVKGPSLETPTAPSTETSLHESQG
jgi:leader peptidase (prepilin peptidase)/N-methyltransferase